MDFDSDFELDKIIDAHAESLSNDEDMTFGEARQISKTKLRNKNSNYIDDLFDEIDY